MFLSFVFSVVYHIHCNVKNVKSKIYAAFPLVFAYVFDVKVIVCIFVIAGMLPQHVLDEAPVCYLGVVLM